MQRASPQKFLPVGKRIAAVTTASSLTYPKTFQISAEDEAPELCETGTIACLDYIGPEYMGTRLEAAGIAVNIIRSARTEEQCNQIDTGQFSIKKEIINGIRFHHGETGGAAAGNVVSGETYHAFHDGACFELAIRVISDNTAHDDSGVVVPFDSTKLEKRLKRVLRTFRFANRSIHQTK